MTSPAYSVTELPTEPGSDMSDWNIVKATEIVIGMAVIVVAEHEDGSIGIGNVVRGRSQSPNTARNKCVTHALTRIASVQKVRVLPDNNDEASPCK